MINLYEVTETNKMIQQENFDVRTITMGINLLPCVDEDVDKTCENVYNRIVSYAKDLVKTGDDIGRDVYKRQEVRILKELSYLIIVKY